MQLDDIGSNLREYYYISEKKDRLNELVGNFKGTRIYYKKHGWGILWNCLQIFFKCLTQVDFKIAWRDRVIKNMQVLFEKECQETEEIAHKYLSTFFEKEAKKAKEFRKKLIEWDKNIPSEKKMNIFPFFPSKQKDKLNFLKEIIYLVSLEHQMLSMLPTKIFIKIGNNQELKEFEKIEFKEWVEKFKKNNTQKVAQIHAALKIFTQKFCAEENQKEDFLSNLEATIFNFLPEESNIFLQPDRRHLYACKTNTNEISEYVLTNEDPESRILPQFFRCWSIQDQPNKIFVLGINSAILGLLQARTEKRADSVPVLQFQRDKKGMGFLIDKIVSLDKIDWDDVNAKQKMERIGKLINEFLKTSCYPKKLDPHIYYFNNKNEIFLSPAIEFSREIDLRSLETFLYDISKGNLEIFKQLILESKLFRHEIASSFKKLFRDITSKNNANLNTKHFPKNIAAGMEELKSEFITYKKEWFHSLQVTHGVCINEKKLEAILNEYILQAHEEINVSSIFLKDLKEIVIKKVMEALKNEK